MSLLTRRQVLGAAAVGAAGFWNFSSPLGGVRVALAGMAPAERRGLRIVDIERHVILAPYHDYSALALLRYHSVANQYRTIFVAKAENGLEGYGESPGRGWPAEGELQKYIGTDPFDWIGDTANLPINMALYDLMGKHLGLPAWKLIGPKVRDWVNVAAWTVSQHPELMAEEVRSVARRGYHWLKYHVDQPQNVIDQTQAMQSAAPKGFKVHYDFNANSNVEAVYPVLKELERFPIAGRVEDPILPADEEGYRLLRHKCKLSILLHHAPPKVMVNRLCDGYMVGHSPVGMAAQTAAVADATNTPFMLQNVGGTINQAFLAHEAAVFKMATIDHVNLCHLWKDDVTTDPMPVVGGSVKVPSGSGLGVALDYDKLEMYKRQPEPDSGRFLVRTKYASGLTVYFRHDPSQPGQRDGMRYLQRRGVAGPVPGYGNAVVTDFWDEPGSVEFKRIYEQAEAGPVTVDGR